MAAIAHLARDSDGDDRNACVDPRDVEQVLLAAAETIASCMQAAAEISELESAGDAPARVSPASSPPESRIISSSEGKIDSLVPISHRSSKNRDASTDLSRSAEQDGRSSRKAQARIIQTSREGHPSKRLRSSSSPSGVSCNDDAKKSKQQRVSVFERLAFPPVQEGNGDPFLEPGALEGMIFGCTTETKRECERRKLFGLPASNQANVLRVAPGTVLFLFNYDTKELSGVYEAVSHGAMNIVADAFEEWGSFPAQVEVRRVLKCQELPFSHFKRAILENFFTDKKFHYDLTGYQVRSTYVAIVLLSYYFE
ncbi:uncharacterized protein LOC112349609 isoform X1 [Selaginella moellendorffii]|uniref:uncharacterized protein LOC112349609 isoform X1 n=1 Tax=Selaginella moellendorffii TaxID=88036 RepID=UPI000D1CE8DA|nr:uncharacterized protein LOC112349609 isoform X1 [Selaginella moellendorffii]|eukprot:XP_024540097.1 uncharacterized protein LOC112349609 isoform X1 [Selaginella moellendorffii]